MKMDLSFSELLMEKTLQEEFEEGVKESGVVLDMLTLEIPWTSMGLIWQWDIGVWSLCKSLDCK